MDVVRLGIIGVGGMGSYHARTLLDGKVPGMELKAVADINPEALKGFAGKPGVATYPDATALIGSGDADAVLIATPHYGHTTIGIEALQAGLHVLVEKPISVHKADCERLIAAHTDEKQVFCAMFNQRTDPHYQKLRRLIRGGELGRVNRINWITSAWFRPQAYYASGGWRATWEGEGGGVLLNQCPHQLDLWQWLFGMPMKVRAFCALGRFHDIEVEDDVTAYLEYADGATGVFITSTGEAPGTNRLEVAAEQGKVVIEGGRVSYTRNEVQTSEFSRTATHSFASPETWQVDIPVSGGGEQHLGILKNFSEAIREGAELLARAEEGIHSVELGNAMLLSSECDRTVELPMDGAEFEALLKKKIASSEFVKKTSGKTGTTASDFAKSF